jgi:hypothetical protein
LIGEAAKANAEIAKEALDWYKSEYEKQKPRQAQLDKISSELAEQQIDTSRFNTQMARDQWDRYQAVGIPTEDAMYRDAATYDSADKQAQAAGQASTDVETAMASAADAKRRTLARMGVNPADGASLALEQDAATAGALAKAGAMTSARTQVKNMGIMLRKDAANFAKGMPSTAAQTYGVAGVAGAGATGAIQGSIAAANQGIQTAGQGFDTAIKGNATAGSILNQEYGNQVAANNSSNSSTASMAGTAASIGIAI